MLTDKEDFLQNLSNNEGIIYKLARMYANDPEELKDMYQEVVLQAWKSWPRFKGQSKFSTWLYRICLNTLLTQKRKKNLMTYDSDLEAIAPSVGHSSVENEQVRALYAAIRTLAETDRALISLHLDGFHNPEIAEMTGISPNYVAVKLHRIKEQLEQRLKSPTYGY